MRVLSLIHHEIAGSGVFADEVGARGHELEEWQPAAGPLPRPLSEYGAVIAFGGGMQADEEGRHPWLLDALELLRECVERGVPTLGVCLGGQMLARAAGGWVGPAPDAEWGWCTVELTEAGTGDRLLAPCAAGPGSAQFEVFQWHSFAFETPPGAVALATSAVSLQAFRVGDRAWGLQWHPEVTGESIRVWAQLSPPAPGGVAVTIDRNALESDVLARIEETNAAGRRLCGRFLELAADA
jgi:GMP synthase-like glutamine amidotransferase